MNCATFEALLMDELYGELDLEASTELAAHLASCEACRTLASDLQAVKSELHVPALEVPTDLHERIMSRVDRALAEAPASSSATPPIELLEAAANANAPGGQVVRPTKWLSHAGAWAMRPQTAMAAVFLLMIGSSAWLLRGQREASMAAVVEEGAPLANEASPSEFNPEAAREAHGLAGGRTAAAAHAPAAVERRREQSDDVAPPPMAAAPADRRQDRGGPEAEPLALEWASGDTSTADRAFEGEPEAKQQAKGKAAESSFEQAMAAYRAKRYDEATAQFDQLASRGDRNAALYAARSVHKSHGCRTALTRYDHLGSTAMGTPPGNDAILEGALCYRYLGQIESSTQHLQRLLAYESHSQRARAELDTNRRILQARRDAQAQAAAGAGAGAAGGSAAGPAAPAARSSSHASPKKSLGADDQ